MKNNTCITIDVQINKEHLKRTKEMCDKISSAISEYLKYDNQESKSLETSQEQ